MSWSWYRSGWVKPNVATSSACSTQTAVATSFRSLAGRNVNDNTATIGRTSGRCVLDGLVLEGREYAKVGDVAEEDRLRR